MSQVAINVSINCPLICGISATNGQGKGGAIFVNTGATVTSIGTPIYSGNRGTNAGDVLADNNNV